MPVTKKSKVALKFAEPSSVGSSSSDESDYLDNATARKRRRTEDEVANDDEDDDSEDVGAPVDDDDDYCEDEDNEDNEPIKHILTSFAAPSRIRPKGAASGPTTKFAATRIASDETSAIQVLAPTDPNTTFLALNVRPWLVQSLDNMAIKRPTGIQKGCIPEILKGRDCIGGSRTGSGKTVAFAVPILQKWAEDPSAIFGVVLTPTRELALQIYEQFRAIAAPQSLKILLITGGSDMRPQAIALGQRPHIIIATPGRLADHIRTSGEDTICGLRRVRYIVLDEADRLLQDAEVGSMLPDVEKCLSVLPPPTERQTLLFTATMTPEVRALQSMPQKPGKQPVFVCEVDTQTLAIPATLSQRHIQIPVTHKEHYLHSLYSATERAPPSSYTICCACSSTV
ncbi:hypothetical protein NQ176_g9522 [Zarea fungicola]|uniref:Uncharacterized protein n=1 Tax=Zarea fungicola TaxID=93591 RepID=A0ACC1MM36_9HYPO|nr:hypothetical protein NQ176_g9522 [Lecanicillium fungicola]